MELKQSVILDHLNGDGCFSIKKQPYIELAGVSHNVGQPERCAFCPGEFDALKAYAPEFETMAKAIWTPEVLAAWKMKQSGVI